MRCRRAARAGLDECGLPSFRPERICGHKGIHYSHDAELPEGIWGALMRKDGEFAILVSVNCPTAGIAAASFANQSLKSLQK